MRAFAAHQRELAAIGRDEAAVVREEAAAIRAQSAAIRDDGARTRDEAARVRDDAARVRDLAARARDQAIHTREEALRKRLLRSVSIERAEWTEVLELDRLAADQSREAALRDREATALDRIAADKDRDAAERDRSAAASDRVAADKDRDAAEKDRLAADQDRSAAEGDRTASEHDLGMAEGQLAKADRFATMGRFAAGVAHEINNPLATLLTTLSNMQLTLQRKSGEGADLGVLVQDARLAADRIAHVIAEMKAWLYDGGALPARQPVDLTSLIQESLRLAAVEQVAKIVVDVQETAQVWGVPSRLGQVLTNLLLNAAHAISGRREDNEISIRVRPHGEMVQLEVSDTGSGIAPDVLRHVFDPFFTTREGSGGTGIGLAMCERIVSEHGGVITVETEVGKGSTFRVELPCGTESVLHPSDAPPPEPELARVLLIDDDMAFTRSIKMVLAGRAEVTVAVDGREGLARLLAPHASYHVVLCDLMMPVMNGLEMYKRLRAVAPERAADLVFISGGATTPETREFLAGLPNVQLQKPFDVERLFRLIEERRESTVPPPRP